MAINGIVQYTSGFLTDILLFTRAPILVRFDGTVIDSSTIHLTMFNIMFCYDWCPCMAINISAQYNGGFLPDITLLTQDNYHHSLGNPVKYHVVALYL